MQSPRGPSARDLPRPCHGMGGSSTARAAGTPSSHTNPCIDPPLRSPAAYPLRASEHTTGTLTGAAKATRGRDTRSPRTWYEVRQI